MMLEVEVKIRADHKNIREKLLNMGFECGTTEYEKDIYFNGDVKDMRAEGKALRIRESVAGGSRRFTLNYKGPKKDRITMTREETEFEIPSFEDGLVLLAGLGFAPAGEVEKKRIHFVLDDITCCLDLVTGLGEFLEVEILTDSEDCYEEVLERIRDLIETLGLSMEDSLTHSYLSMLQQAR